MAGENVVSTIRSWIGWILSSCRIPIRTCNRTTGPFWTRRSICARGCHREHTRSSDITRQLRISWFNHCWRHLLDP